MQMQNNKKNFDAPIDASKIGQEDERLRLLQQIKSARSQAGLFARANEKYNTKRWEDAWAPYYRIATSSAVVGGVISFLIGWAGCTLIATALFGSLMGYTVGTAVAILIEFVKFFCLKYGSENLFAGRTVSAAIQMAVGVAALVLSIYTSYQSATQTDVFRQWVQREAASSNTEVEGVAELNKAIAKEEATLAEIARERNSYQEKNKAKSADWLRAKEETASMSEIARLEAERTRLSSDTTATAAALSWWVYLFIILPDLLVIFGTIFTEYYEYRVYELMVVGGKQTMTETVNVHNNTPTVYQLRDSNQQQEQRTLPPPAPDDEARKEIAALREALRALQEQQRTITPPPTSDNDATRQELAALREALHALQEQKRTTPPLPSPEPPTHPPSNGKTEMGYKRAAILDTDEDSSHSSHKVETVATVATEYAEMDSESLLDSFRSLMSRKKSWERRDTVTAKHNVARCEIRTEAIQSVLKGRGEVIELVDRAYKIVRR